MAVVDSRPHESKLYYEFSHFYDRIFERVFSPRIHSTICSLNIPAGARLLEVGVGTGLSLESYPENTKVVGIDLARGMLDRAQGKIDEHGWTHIELHEMNALELNFPEGHFDYVMAFHVLSVVPDHDRLMREMSRVCKAGGRIVIINHFRSQRPWLARVVDRLDPLTRTLGWRTTLRFSELFQNMPLRVERRFKTKPQSLFTVVVASRLGG